jgi:hypothetical protein
MWVLFLVHVLLLSLLYMQIYILRIPIAVGIYTDDISCFGITQSFPFGDIRGTQLRTC